jgi:hypothetical protein
LRHVFRAFGHLVINQFNLPGQQKIIRIFLILLQQRSSPAFRSSRFRFQTPALANMKVDLSRVVCAYLQFVDKANAGTEPLTALYLSNNQL